MKKVYQEPKLKRQCLTLDEALLSNEAEGGSFPDIWNEVGDRFKDEF